MIDYLLIVQKAPCENTFRAITNTLLASRACDVTGVVSFACARHGCFVPNSLVNLFKGEQQKNVDFAFLQALRHSNFEPEQGAGVIYDIACQWCKHLLERIGTQLPVGLDLEYAIGLFHVHAHKEECFFRYATSFIPGMGVVAGEILESLWSNLNAISPTARTATLAHRAEILDDHASDSNHKKCLGMVRYLSRRYEEASGMSEQVEKYFTKLTGTISHEDQAAWEREITHAENNRHADVTIMDVYASRMPVASGPVPAPAPVAPPSTNLGEVWLRFALMVEEKQ